MEWSFWGFYEQRASTFASGVLEWSQILEWKKTVCALLIKLCILIYGVEYWSGVLESDFGVAKVEWSAVVMCVCVANFYVIL